MRHAQTLMPATPRKTEKKPAAPVAPHGRQRLPTAGSDEKRERILKAAEALFDRYGYASTTIEQIVQALGAQMLLCPLQGAMRNLYLSGKALELTATVMTGVEQRDDDRPVMSLGTQDVRRLRLAQDILLQRLQDPPTLPALARQIGTNVNKLTVGFRQLFGTSVYGFVREQRLALAYRMLAAGQISVTDAAQACGYSSSHFTKAFRHRYGVAPSALTER